MRFLIPAICILFFVTLCGLKETMRRVTILEHVSAVTLALNEQEIKTSREREEKLGQEIMALKYSVDVLTEKVMGQ